MVEHFDEKYISLIAAKKALTLLLSKHLFFKRALSNNKVALYDFFINRGIAIICCFHLWSSISLLQQIQKTWFFALSSIVRGGSRAAATSKMEHFVIIVNGWKPLTIITKYSILDVAAALEFNKIGAKVMILMSGINDIDVINTTYKWANIKKIG